MNNSELRQERIREEVRDQLESELVQDFETAYSDEDVFRDWASDKTREELIEFILCGVDYLVADEFEDHKKFMIEEFYEVNKK